MSQKKLNTLKSTVVDIFTRTAHIFVIFIFEFNNFCYFWKLKFKFKKKSTKQTKIVAHFL